MAIKNSIIFLFLYHLYYIDCNSIFIENVPKSFCVLYYDDRIVLESNQSRIVFKEEPNDNEKKLTLVTLNGQNITFKTSKDTPSVNDHPGCNYGLVLHNNNIPAIANVNKNHGCDISHVNYKPTNTYHPDNSYKPNTGNTQQVIKPRYNITNTSYNTKSYNKQNCTDVCTNNNNVKSNKGGYNISYNTNIDSYKNKGTYPNNYQNRDSYSNNYQNRDHYHDTITQIRNESVIVYTFVNKGTKPLYPAFSINTTHNYILDSVLGHLMPNQVRLYSFDGYWKSLIINPNSSIQCGFYDPFEFIYFDCDQNVKKINKNRVYIMTETRDCLVREN